MARYAGGVNTLNHSIIPFSRFCEEKLISCPAAAPKEVSVDQNVESIVILISMVYIAVSV